MHTQVFFQTQARKQQQRDAAAARRGGGGDSRAADLELEVDLGTADDGGATGGVTAALRVVPQWMLADGVGAAPHSVFMPLKVSIMRLRVE